MVDYPKGIDVIAVQNTQPAPTGPHSEIPAVQWVFSINRSPPTNGSLLRFERPGHIAYFKAKWCWNPKISNPSLQMSYKVSISMHGNLRFVISMAVWDFSVGWFDRLCAAAKRSQPLHPCEWWTHPLICSRLFSFVRIIAWNKIAWPSGGCLRCVKAKRFSAFNSNPPLSIAGAGHFQRSFSQAEGEMAAERRRPCCSDAKK